MPLAAVVLLLVSPVFLPAQGTPRLAPAPASSVSSAAPSLPLPLSNGRLLRNARSSSSTKTVTSSKTSVLLPHVLKSRIVYYTNIERKRQNLPLLQRNSRLERAAQKHAEDMARRNYLHHTSPEGVDPIARIRAEGYGETSCSCTWTLHLGENVAWGSVTPERIMEYWLRSAEHRVHILNPHYTDIGIGIAGSHWVQTFGGLEIEPITTPPTPSQIPPQPPARSP